MMYSSLYELDPNLIDHATMLGYPCRELLLFAQACRLAGIADSDLYEFAHNVKKAYELVYSDIKRSLDNAIERQIWMANSLAFACPEDVKEPL